MAALGGAAQLPRRAGADLTALEAAARRAEVQPKPCAKKLSELKLVRLTPEEIGKGIPEVIEQWRDTFGG